MILFLCLSRVVAVEEASVVIAVSSVHRKEAIEAVHYCIDALKTSVPIWKKVTWIMSAYKSMLNFSDFLNFLIFIYFIAVQNEICNEVSCGCLLDRWNKYLHCINMLVNY